MSMFRTLEMPKKSTAEGGFPRPSHSLLRWIISWESLSINFFTCSRSSHRAPKKPFYVLAVPARAPKKILYCLAVPAWAPKKFLYFSRCLMLVHIYTQVLPYQPFYDSTTPIPDLSALRISIPVG